MALSRYKRRFVAKGGKYFRPSLILLLAAVIVLVFYLLVQMLMSSPFGNLFVLGRNFVLTPSDQVLQINSRTNIVLLGKAGAGSDSPDLADTIIFISIKHSRPQTIDIVSLPRDIWLPELRAKLNSVYFWGNQKQEGGGLTLGKSVVEQILGQPIHYGMVLDFSGFVELVDFVGGVEVMVERSFTDEFYPIPGREDDECDGDPEFNCRYETVIFEEGLQIMDGETALKFVRSRRSEDLIEGTDQARSLRQQQVVRAVQTKLVSSDTLRSPGKILGLWDLFQKITETDIPNEALSVLARRGVQAQENIKSHTIPDNLLLNPPLSPKRDNLYVFIPANENEEWTDVHSWMEEILN